MLAVSSFFRGKEHNTREAMKANMDSENGNRSGLFVVPKLHPGDCLPEKTLGTLVLAARPKRKNRSGEETREGGCKHRQEIV